MARRLMGACALAALGVACAGAAHSQPVTVNFTIYDTAEKTRITSPGYNGGGYAAPLLMTITAGGPPQSLYVFCIDVFNTIGTRETGLSYQQTALAGYDGGTGTTLTPVEVVNIGKLIGYGENLVTTDAGDPTLDAQLAGVQDAIWSTEYPSAGYSFTPIDPAAATFEAADLSMLSTLPVDLSVSAFVSVDGNTQAVGGGGGPGIIGGGSGVPEPASWALMLLGVGITGAALRRRPVTV